ncbi:hypothetical protein NGB36_02205 [Streptomyces sp. RB6PN25]|uniref:Uncharacterized protein n=1 Tax=Streptomyces humicola TaxID=2953240 RepID=A0ABT1PP34_9ACTN|nr:hypothetical protein [Streptomyces humicola]MCQ4079443.1 hypothetical protein [Streptomyces humicola]
MGEQHPLVVVHSPGLAGRRVTVNGEYVGRAHRPRELRTLLRREGIDTSEIRLDDPKVIEWRGGGPEVWPT